MRETKFIILAFLQSVNFSIYFPLLLHVISTTILKFTLWFPASLPDSTHFLYFALDSLHSHTDSSHLHSHLIPRIPTPNIRIFLIPFSNSPFWL